MTFTPTPKADLIPLVQLGAALDAVNQQVLSRLHHAEHDADWAASAIADLYANQPGGGGIWDWSGQPFGTDPGAGAMLITIAAGNNRTIVFAKADADGVVPSLDRLTQGSTLVVTDDPAAPPITAFRQYVVVNDPTDHGAWVSMQCLRVATFGTQDTPTVGTRVRMLFR